MLTFVRKYFMTCYLLTKLKVRPLFTFISTYRTATILFPILWSRCLCLTNVNIHSTNYPPVLYFLKDNPTKIRSYLYSVRFPVLKPSHLLPVFSLYLRLVVADTSLLQIWLVKTYFLLYVSLMLS